MHRLQYPPGYDPCIGSTEEMSHMGHFSRNRSRQSSWQNPELGLCLWYEEANTVNYGVAGGHGSE